MSATYEWTGTEWVALCQECGWGAEATPLSSALSAEQQAFEHNEQRHDGPCATCYGSGLVSTCTPRSCDGSHIACDSTDCPDCLSAVTA